MRNIYNLRYISDSADLSIVVVGHLQETATIQNLKETRDSRYICRNELDKACFQHDMAH